MTTTTWSGRGTEGTSRISSSSRCRGGGSRGPGAARRSRLRRATGRGRRSATRFANMAAFLLGRELPLQVVGADVGVGGGRLAGRVVVIADGKNEVRAP